MATIHFDCLSNLRKGRYDWIIKVRLIRKWRNSNSDGKLVKGFNIMLLDDKNVTMQAFVGDSCFEKFLNVFNLGQVYVISNFSIKDVGTKDKYLLTQTERIIYFSSYTTVEPADDIHSLIPNNVFDFYEIADLDEMLNQDRYLTDVIGVVEDYQPIRRWISKIDNATRKSLLKFSLSDGSAFVKCVLWDEFAENFHSSIHGQLEEPWIVIVAGAKIVQKETLEISTVRATTFYINYHHHSTQQLRQRVIATPDFINLIQASKRDRSYTELTVADLNKLGKDKIESRVMLTVTIKKMKIGIDWFFYECTTCFEEVKSADGIFRCTTCDRVVPYPDRKFQVYALCSDETGTVNIFFNDREVRRLTNKTVFCLTDIDGKGDCLRTYPDVLHKLVNRDVRVLLHLAEDNIVEECNLFHAAEVSFGYSESDGDIQSLITDSLVSQISSQYSEGTSSTGDYHLDSMTQLNLALPSSSNSPHGKAKMKGAIPPKKK